MILIKWPLLIGLFVYIFWAVVLSFLLVSTTDGVAMFTLSTCAIIASVLLVAPTTSWVMHQIAYIMFAVEIDLLSKESQDT